MPLNHRLVLQAGRGACAGLAGTLGMTLVGMKPGIVRWLPEDMQPDRWLPHTLVRQLLRSADEDDEDARHGMLLTTALHFGYGAAAGAAYALLRRQFGRGPGWLAGASYGVLLWAVSYEGWIPALGLLPPTTRAPAYQWIVPVGSHLIYGGVTGYADEQLAA